MLITSNNFPTPIRVKFVCRKHQTNAPSMNCGVYERSKCVSVDYAASGAHAHRHHHTRTFHKWYPVVCVAELHVTLCLAYVFKMQGASILMM